ncbi:MAG TPA: hypothetical protein VGG74_35560 [Kofleriaceae bacterium]
MDCSKLITTDDIASLCKSTRKLAAWTPDSDEGNVTEPTQSKTPCSRSVRIESGEVFLHVQVIDYGTSEALETLMSSEMNAYPTMFHDGLYIHEQHEAWWRRDVEYSNKGKLSVSVFETDQPGHEALCSSEHLVDITRRMQDRLP